MLLLNIYLEGEHLEFKHKPVLLNECIEGLNIKPDGIYVDGTLGGAGHSREIAKNLSEKGILIGIDRDEEALAAATEALSADTYTNVGGTGRSNLSTAVNTTYPTSVVEVDETQEKFETATASLTALTTTFKNGVANWNTYTNTRAAVATAKAEADLIDEGQSIFNGGYAVLAGGRDTCSLVDRLHSRFAFPERKLIRLYACRYVEILSQLSVEFQPVLVVGFDPVNTAVLESKICDRTVDLAVIFHGIHFIILSQRSFQIIVQRIIRSITDAQNVGAVKVQSVTEITEVIRKVW